MTSLSLHFEIAQSRVLSANARQHWAAKARMTADLRALGKYAAAYQNDRIDPDDEVWFDRAQLTVRVGWPDKRRRDVHNLAPTIKALIDGCVDAGLLPDDDDTHLIGPDLRPYVAGRKGLVVLDFEFEEVA
jgi:crossover junction endodeoxyribonuclease RusA